MNNAINTAAANTNLSKNGYHTEGAKYDATQDLDITAIAKLVRADIKAAIKAGTIPAVKTSVRIERFSMGQSLSVKITAVPEGFEVINPESVREDLERPHSLRTVERSPESAVAVLKTIESMVRAYNRTASDSQTDYYNTRFYVHVDYSWELERDERNRITAELSAPVAPATIPAPAPVEPVEPGDMVSYLEAIGAL